MKKKVCLSLAAVVLICLAVVGYRMISAPHSSNIADAVATSGITAEDLTKAALYFKKTSEQGDSDEYDLEYKFAKAAAELGDADAMLYMGEMYQGSKISQASEGDNIQTAIKWWEKAAENGQARGYTNIGLLYMHQTVPGGGDDFGNIAYEPETAIGYYEKAAALNDFKAYRYLGLAYQDGVGVSQSDEKAYENFKKAADLGDSTGKLYQADYLLAGKGTAQNTEMAMGLYQDLIDSDAHDKGTAAYKLGTIYQKGTGVAVDIEKAKVYYQIALETATKEKNNELANQANEALSALR